MLRTQTGRFAIQAFAAPIKALFIAVILYFGSGCSSSTKSADAKEQSAAGRRDTGHKVDINCLGDHVSNPSDSFHYSFKATDEQNAVDKEADVTPQTMVVTIQDKWLTYISRYPVRRRQLGQGRSRSFGLGPDRDDGESSIHRRLFRGKADWRRAHEWLQHDTV